MSGSPPCGPEASAADMCFVAVFVAHTQHTSLGSGRNNTVRTERTRAPCSPPNGSDAHPAACPNKAVARRIASRGTRRFSAGPTYGTRSGAASSWAAPPRGFKDARHATRKQTPTQ